MDRWGMADPVRREALRYQNVWWHGRVRMQVLMTNGERTPVGEDEWEMTVQGG